jgi:type I restriction enzyme R subunit
MSFVKETQPEKWEKLETAHKGSAEQAFLRDLTSALERQGPIEVIRHGLRTTGTTIDLAAFQPVTGFNPEIKRRYEANRLGVTRQLHYSETDPQKSIDLVLSLNGIPVATAELKNPLTDQTVDDAGEQYASDRDPSEPLFKFNRGALIHFAIDPNLVEYTTKLDGDDTKFLPFNKGRDGGAGNHQHPSGHRTAYLWEDIWAKDSWMDIIQRFVHIETEEIREDGVLVEEKKKLIFPRFHQLECVRNLLDAAADEGPGHNYLIQHSTGSGKSKSIGWLSHRFVSLHDDNDEKVFDSVIVVTDRRVLDTQLQDTIYQLDHKTGVVHGIEGDGRAKSEELAEALERGKPIIITTLQTFPYVIEQTASIPERDYAVIVDEAHSSQTGEMAKEMKQILAGIEIEEDDDWEDMLAKSAEARGKQENLSFFAFTATPKGKTLEVFGRPRESDDTNEPFHVYSMRQAIEEGFILDVLENYTTYNTYYNLVKAVEDDPSVPKSKAMKAVAQYLTLHPHNVAQKVEIIVEHFREHTMHKIGGKAKAMIVTSSRKHAVRYKLAIDEYLDEQGYNELKALVAFSGTVEDEGAEYTEPQMNDGIKETELPEKFSSNEYRVLVVAEKYQTGFDQPLLHTMYVDKSLTGIRAVQTLGRLNRTHPGKEDTLVIDFVNDREDILDAFQPFYEKTTLEESSDPQHLYQLESDLEASQVFTDKEVDNLAEAFFSPDNTGTEKAHAKLYQYTNPAVDRFNGFTEEKQSDFRSKLNAFIRLYKFQSQVVDYTDTDLEKLYAYARFLNQQLPRDSDQFTVEFDDELALRYYRIEKESEGRLRLKDQGGSLSPPIETGTGSKEEEEVQLSTLIDRINEQLGTDFTAADEYFFKQIKEDALEDDHLRESAKVNTKENFAHEFDGELMGLFIERMDQNEEMFSKFIDNADFREVVTQLLREEVYEESQELEEDSENDNERLRK